MLIKSLMGALKLCKFLKWVRRQTFVSFSSSNVQKYKTNVKLYLTVRRQDLLTLSLLVFDFLLQRSMHTFSIMSLTVHLLCYLLQLHLNWWTLRSQGQDNLLYTHLYNMQYKCITWTYVTLETDCSYWPVAFVSSSLDLLRSLSFSARSFLAISSWLWISLNLLIWFFISFSWAWRRSSNSETLDLRSEQYKKAQMCDLKAYEDYHL